MNIVDEETEKAQVWTLRQCDIIIWSPNKRGTVISVKLLKGGLNATVRYLLHDDLETKMQYWTIHMMEIVECIRFS